MSSAGYGNHDASNPGSAASSNTGTAAQPGADHSVASIHPAPGIPSSPTDPDETRRPVAAPGDGAGPASGQGDEVDPGTG